MLLKRCELLLSKKERSLFSVAKSLAELSDHRCKIGCIIVDKHRIISSGHNSNTKCHPIQAKIDTKHFNCFCTGKLHAETSAIVPLLRTEDDYSRATLYTYREHADGTLANSRPCARCIQLIKQIGITRIRYTTEEGYASEYLEKIHD